jgi:hypothetical protein
MQPAMSSGLHSLAERHLGSFGKNRTLTLRRLRKLGFPAGKRLGAFNSRGLHGQFGIQGIRQENITSMS